MISSNLKNWLRKSKAVGILFLMSSPAAFASTTGSNLPFVSPMNMLKDAITGPFLYAAACIMLVVTLLVLAFADPGDGHKKLINMVFWLSIAFGVVAFIAALFKGASGAVF
jgi:type IV secretion system protein TrbC